jgi:thioredoxin
MKQRWFIFFLFLAVYIVVCFFTFSCKGENSSLNQPPTPSPTVNPRTAVTEIQGEESLMKIIEEPNKLMVFDLYADWCGPCQVLSPMLEKIARENKDKADFYKIDVDQQPRLSALFKVSGIPYVVFLKNKTILYALTGLYPKEEYIKVINRLSEKGNEELASGPDGEIVDDIRVIRFTAGINPSSIYVYRGETVKLVIDKQGYAFSVHLPDFGLSQKANKDEGLEITFKADKIGVFPIFCNGNCPAGDGALHGKIIVMPYQASGESVFKELTAAEAKAMIETSQPLILDVRTPNEYYNGHLAGATLIPLQQLSQRLSEIQQYKGKEILIYCRSGNRSTVASEILIENGFKKLYNLRTGILGWQKEGFKIQQEDTGIRL